MAATTEVMGVGSKRRSWRHRASKSIRSILHLPPRTQQSPAVEEVADRKTWMVQESRRTSDVLLRSSPKAPHPSPTTAFERWQQQNEAAPDKSQFTKEYVIETPIVFSIFVSTDSSIKPKVTVCRELEESNQKTREESVEDLIITNKEALELQNARPPVRLQESIDPARFSLHFEDKIFTNNRRASQKVGERGSGLRARGSVQDFAKLRAQCLEDGVLFEDPDFPATDETIFFSRSAPRSFEWKRPHELCEDPRFFYDGASRFDVRQGELGDCWLLAAVSNLTLNPVLFHRVVPDDQSFQQDYAGIFHFRFWQYGRWVDVVIDDRLPTYYGQLVFLHSQEKNEFWSALLEKAYAKLHGSYEALKGGTTCEAMEDFTGGLTEFFELDKAPKNLFTIMLKAYDRSSLMGCAIEPDPEVPEAELPNGLIRGHAYSITAVKLVKIQTPRMSGKIPLLRIRNPWGNEAEWKGAWSDKSAEWRFIPDDEKQELGLTFESDGEFWISFADFMKNFNRMEICNLNPDSLEDDELDSAKKKWQISTFEGSWIKGVTAGGCRNYLDTFWYNPQYRITLEDPDEEDDEEKCTVIVALMQKNRRRQRKMGAEVLTIGFAIYHLKNPEGLPKPLGKDFFKYTASTVRSPSFINLREVSCRFKLPPGTYCIVPSTFEPNEEGEFVLRVYSEKKNDMEELDDDVGMGEIDDRINQDVTDSDNRHNNVQTKLDDEKEAAIKECFQRIAGEDLEIDARELRDVLDHIFKKEFEFDGFGEDVCRSMVAMMDVDRSGKLGLEEFKQLWLSIYTWKGVFKLYDKDNSGTLSTFELRSALASAGYHLNWHILKALALRYGSKTGTISFDDFILCAVKLKTMIETFKERDPKGTNEATFSLEEWVEKTMYA